MPSNPSDFIGAFMADYFAECDEHLGVIRRHLLTLETAVGDAAPAAPVVDELFRSFHSLKGISAMVELREAERLAHEMESCLRAIRAREIAVSAPTLDALVGGVHALEHVIAARRSGIEMPPIDAPLARLAEVSRAPETLEAESDTAGAAPGRDAGMPQSGRRWRVTFTPSADLVTRGIKVDTIRTRLSAVGHIESVAPRVTGSGGIAFDFFVTIENGDVFAAWRDDGIEAEEAAAAPPLAATPARAPAPRAFDAPIAPTNFVRVDLARLDDLMRLVGDLVVSRSRLEDALLRVERLAPSTEWRTLLEHSEGIERLLRDLREGVMRVRLVPVGEIFRRMPFVVRDLARDNGKRIQVSLAGQATEIDKFLIERMMDPVLHLVRNAISHGIEAPEERIAAGKPPDGTIRLAASTVGESVMLEVGDDGRGMDAAAIARRAREIGMDVPDGELDPRALLEVIASPGFSTRAAADRASGRGVGMAVVRDTIQELGGTLAVETELGKGTTFHIGLPLTLAITDALIVHVGDRVFAVPQSAVREVADVEQDLIRVIENNELIVHRGVALPIVRLARLFGLAEAPRARRHVIVVGAGSAAVGILVDRIAGQREIVVKTLNDPLTRVAGVSGATELGDGRLVLILEPVALTRKVRGRAAMRAAG